MNTPLLCCPVLFCIKIRKWPTVFFSFDRLRMTSPCGITTDLIHMRNSTVGAEWGFISSFPPTQPCWIQPMCLVCAGGNIWTRQKQEWIKQVCKWDECWGSLGNFRKAIIVTWHRLVCIRWMAIHRINLFWASHVKSEETVSPLYWMGVIRLQVIM